MNLHRSGLWGIDFMSVVVKDGAKLPDIPFDGVSKRKKIKRLKVPCVASRGRLGVTGIVLLLGALIVWIDRAPEGSAIPLIGFSGIWTASLLFAAWRNRSSKVIIEASRFSSQEFLISRMCLIILIPIIFVMVGFTLWTNPKADFAYGIHLANPIAFSLMTLIRRPLFIKSECDEWHKLELPIEVLQAFKQYARAHSNEFESPIAPEDEPIIDTSELSPLVFPQD